MSEYKIPKRHIKLLDKRLLKIECGEEKLKVHFYVFQPKLKPTSIYLQGNRHLINSHFLLKYLLQIHHILIKMRRIMVIKEHVNYNFKKSTNFRHKSE
jgi:hypothetical protein